ncbi:hypothetical protein AKJ57_00485 [candidate division MSBL1 archaeon SCGC-AAA259A05]|uniref:MacB-like periplasmic core domain-containing protein n=1 Tax=candidate division MSBL1 archaeon SCGC-AAA259A05 TaxID=1698259 RepID=A0A133UBT9_9EURY|nr:hypothetical protein AKJ57_00485 [candidate division MSBL1 archaeon SCGC-AAA259A05]
MSPLKFDYLDRRRILGMALIVGIASTLFATLSLPVLGFYRGFTSYLGESENVMAIRQGSSNTPFSGLVPSRMASRASGLSGVETVSPEVIVSTIIDGEPVFVRGIMPKKFLSLSKIEVIRGSELEYGDLNSALVGRELADRLDLDPGDRTVIGSAMADRYSILEVEGIHSSGTALDDEILVPLYQGQWLRGIGHDRLTMMRVEYDRGVTSAEDLRRELVDNEGSGRREKFWNLIPVSEISVGGGKVNYARTEEYMRDFLGEYGISKVTLVALAISVFLFAGSAAVFACRHLVKRHEGDIFVLRSIGASKRTLEIDMVFRLLPWMLLSSLSGLGAGYGLTLLLQEGGFLRIVTHTIRLSLDPLMIVGLVSATVGMAIFGVLRAFGEVDEK